MNVRTCPVCGREQDQATTECGRCGWDFSPMLGTSAPVKETLRQRLEQARAAWGERRYNPDLVPELERDPFETKDEFAARIAGRPWYVGEVELQKAGYDLTTGRFPVRFKSINDWAKPALGALAYASRLRLPRDFASAMYRQSAAWPVYAYLAVRDKIVALNRFVLLSPYGELQVESDRVIAGRYCDLGDGTVLDTATGMHWMRCTLSQEWDGQTCVGAGAQFQQDAILEEVHRFNQQVRFAGYRDWRVPTYDELKTLLPVDDEAFPNTPNDHFWSSSLMGDIPGMVVCFEFHKDRMYVDFRCIADQLHTYSSAEGFPVRLVRGVR